MCQVVLSRVKSEYACVNERHRSQHEEIDLVSETEMYDTAPKSISKPVRCSPICHTNCINIASYPGLSVVLNVSC